jgi:hypothetical protein
VWVEKYFGSDDGSWGRRTLQGPEAGGKAAALRALRELAPAQVAKALTQARRSKHPAVRRWAEEEQKK